MLCCAIANLEVIGLHSFRCYRHVALQSLTPGCNLPCVYALLRLISNARFAFDGQNMKFTVNMLLASYSVTPGPAV